MRFWCGRRGRFILLGALAFAIAAAGAGLGASRFEAGDLSSLTERLRALRQDRAEVQQNLRRVKQREQRVSRELDAIEGQLDRAEDRLRDVSLRATQAEADLGRAARKCEAAQVELSTHQDTMSERLVAIYERAETKPIEVLLESTSFADFANRLYLLNQVVARDAELLQQFEQAFADAEANRADMAARARSLAGLQQQVETEQQRIRGQRETTARRKRKILRDRAAWERALAELEENSREVEAMLRRLQRTGATRGHLSQEWTGGKLHRPLAGRVASGFGYRIHPIYRVRKMHTGIDIPAASGAPIRAAAPGAVVYAGRWGGYGNCVIIDHGSGLATLYAHCSSLAVTPGEATEAGETIAYVGSTGLSTGPHLHFEVRRDGRPVNPEPYL